MKNLGDGLAFVVEGEGVGLKRLQWGSKDGGLFSQGALITPPDLHG